MSYDAEWAAFLAAAEVTNAPRKEAVIRGIKSVTFADPAVLEAVLEGLSWESFSFSDGLEYVKVAALVHIGTYTSVHILARRIVDDFSIAVSVVQYDTDEKILTMDHRLFHQDIEPDNDIALSEFFGRIIAEPFETAEF